MLEDQKILVTFFSCTGTTKRVAQNLAEVMGADLYQIKPERPYTDADLNWNDKNSRSSLEMNTPSLHPAIADQINMEEYSVVFIGFPIWWYVAPTIMNTFVESYDFTGKTVISFCTSGGSGLGSSDKILRSCCSNHVNWIQGKRLSEGDSKERLINWVDSLKL